MNSADQLRCSWPDFNVDFCTIALKQFVSSSGSPSTMPFESVAGKPHPVAAFRAFVWADSYSNAKYVDYVTCESGAKRQLQSQNCTQSVAHWKRMFVGHLCTALSHPCSKRATVNLVWWLKSVKLSANARILWNSQTFLKCLNSTDYRSGYRNYNILISLIDRRIKWSEVRD